MVPAMSSRIAIWMSGCILILLLVSSAQAIDYEVHRRDAISINRNGNVILTSRDFLEELNYMVPKTSYTLQEGTEHLLHFGALLRTRILDAFGSLLYVYYDDFSVAEVEALRKVYREILERRYDVFSLVPNVLRNPDTRPSRICAEIYRRAMEPCLRSSASVCRGMIRRQHDLPHSDDTLALNITHQVYRSFKTSGQYPRGFSLAMLLRYLQREELTVTPDLLSGLLFNVRYESYDDDVRLAERELIRHFRENTRTSEISVLLPTRDLRQFHTVNFFLKYFVDMYVEKLPDNEDLKRYAFLMAKRIADDIGMIDENIHLLGNVYENQTIHVEYLFDLVLPDDLLENDVIEAKKYLVTKLYEFNVVERYLKVQKFQQATPAQLTMEITRQLTDIDFAKNIATSLRMYARFWRSSRMIENLDELLELFDAYENLRQVPRYVRMMRMIDRIKESLRDIKDIPVEILCNVPRACLRIGLQLVLSCKLVSSEIKNSIKNFLELSDVCVDPVYMVQESRRSVEIPFKMSKVLFSTALQTATTWLTKETTKTRLTTETTTRPSPTKDKDWSVLSTEEVTESEISSEEVPREYSGELSTTTTTTLRTMTEPIKVISTTHQEEITSTSAAITTTMLPTTTTSAPTISTLLTTTTALPTTTLRPTTLPTTTTTLPTTTTTLPTTTTTLSTTTTTLPTTTTMVSTTTTTLPTTTTTLPTTTTTLPTTTTTTSPTTTTTTLPTTTTTTSPTTTTTTSPTTTTTTSPTTTTTTSPTTTTTTLPTTTTTLSTTTTTTMPITTLPSTTPAPPTTTTTSPTTTTTMSTTTTPMVTTEPSTVNIEMKLKRTKVVTSIPYDDYEITKPMQMLSLTTSAPTRSCESNECTTQLSLEETSQYIETTESPTMTEPTTTQTSILETTRAMTPESSTTCQDDVTTEAPIATTTELNVTPITKDCRSKSESVETGRSCETSCVLEDCDGEDSTTKDHSPECDTEIEGSCGCATKEEKSVECMGTLCPSDLAENSSCERMRNDCATSTMPTVKLKRKRIRGMCEIRDPYHHRQLKRLAKMRAISAAMLRDVRPRTSRRRDRISKKLYNLLATRVPYSENRNRRIAQLLKQSLGGSHDKVRKLHRKQREQMYSALLREQMTRKVNRETTMRHTGDATPFHQTERIPERSISA
ncbi:uncharacterized protein LOC105432760 [Pogonomyrmex barbatus]|uniref:Uncharacterized protein LOC105432760 n=1 Tax=Pogonomyrmex barbatus TaxID=144034 RepID=A0A8N1S9U8_9HYME|nr:uncharacterized protein LOC105432760 [Pogonomyrmex barbatus]